MLFLFCLVIGSGTVSANTRKKRLLDLVDGPELVKVQKLYAESRKAAQQLEVEKASLVSLLETMRDKERNRDAEVQCVADTRHLEGLLFDLQEKYNLCSEENAKLRSSLDAQISSSEIKVYI